MDGAVQKLGLLPGLGYPAVVRYTGPACAANRGLPDGLPTPESHAFYMFYNAVDAQDRRGIALLTSYPNA